jgi:subtilisin
MPLRSRSARRLAVVWVGAAAVLLLASPPLSTQAPPGVARVPDELRDRIGRAGRVRVIVELNVPGGHIPEARLPDIAGRFEQRQRLRALQSRVVSESQARGGRLVRQFETIPYIALEVDSGALTALEHARQDVVRIMDDAIVRPVLSESAPIVQSDQAWDVGYDGTGTTVAVLDTGVEATHPFFAGKVVEEACYSGDSPGISSSFCPNGLTEQIGPGSAAPCWLDGCYHGDHVAGIAAGNGALAEQPFSGVAKGANIMAVQVFSQIDDWFSCGGFAPCLGGFTSDIIAGLERVYAVAARLNVASVNLSLGEGRFTAPCDNQPYKPVIDNLRSIGVATVAASGNSGYLRALMTPACISSVVSVGATDKADNVTYFSNVAPFLSLFAPGDGIISALTGGSFGILSGTSMASPHVAGAWAIMMQALPGSNVTTVLNALRQTGKPIVDTRSGSPITVPRARIFQALASLTPIANPAPVVTSLSPVSARAGVASVMVAGTGFNAFSVVRWNGSARPTSVISATKIRASIPASDLTAVGTADVTVFNPEPGGGSSFSLAFTIEPPPPPPSLTISAPATAAGGSETVTLHDGLGGAYDWLALAGTGASNSSYIKWTYIGAGITNFTWTVTMPTAPGTYEFRLFPDGLYTRAATSPTITVEGPASALPVITALSPDRRLMGGAAFTLVVNGSNFVDGSVVRWNGENRSTTFISSTQLRATIAAADSAVAGTAHVTVFTPPPGGGTSAAFTFTIARPALSVSAQTVTAGASVTVTLTDGAGGTYDWLALASKDAADTSYLLWTYVGSAVTTFTWTVTMPTAPGTYEFRLFYGGSSRAATSPPVTVTGAGAQQPALAVSATSVAPGSPVTVTLTNGSGGTYDWITFAATGAADTSYLQWTYVGAGVRAFTWTVTMPATAGVYEFRFFPNGGYTRAATSAPINVGTASSPLLSVSAQNIGGGASVTVTLTNGPGQAYDWLALAPTEAADSSYLQWTYVGAGVTNRTWTVTMPTAAGTYEFRLFSNGTRAATSSGVTVTGAPPSLSVTAQYVTGGGSVTVTLTNGRGGSYDWLTIAPAAASDTTYLQWTYIGAGVTTFTWTIAMPTAPGPYEFRLFLNGGYTRAATSPVITVE